MAGQESEVYLYISIYVDIYRYIWRERERYIILIYTQ